MLKIKNLHVHYGAIHAIKGIDFEVKQGTIVTLIGANGAGKTTILKTISRLISSTSGEINYLDQNITSIAAHDLVKLGLSQVPEGRRVFTQMTVLENLEMGAYPRHDKETIQKDIETVFHHFPRLKERIHQTAGTLSGGEQQMLAMGRALMSRPKILLLDEPSMGLAPLLVQEIFHIIETINAQGTTILLVEQNAHRALSISHYAYVLETGKITMQGLANELMNDQKIKEAYLSA